MTNSILYNLSQALNQEKAPPALYIVATPIGNLEDITIRALRILNNVSQIACEDTRVSQKLLTHYDIKKKLISYNDFSSTETKNYIIQLIQQGESIALISDAGTPLISDPGYKLVSEAIAHQIPVIPIPGPSALTASLSACGISTDEFFFYGFLPKKEKEIQAALKKMEALQTTIVFYDTSKRLLKSLELIQAYFNEEFELCVAREITKKFETFKKDKVQNLILFFEEHPPKGEIVVILNTRTRPKAISESEIIQQIKNFPSETSTKTITQILSEQYPLPKKTLYQLILEHKNE